MADFLKAYWYMMGDEDVSPKNPKFGRTTIDNNGGRVRLGLNSKYHQDLVPLGYYDTMTVSEAVELSQKVYKSHEWLNIRGEEIINQKVASKFLSMAVNMGSVQAIKLIQRACGSTSDGVLGPITLKAINSTNELGLLAGMVIWLKWFIDMEIANKPMDAPYKEEWIRRAERQPESDTTESV